MKPIEDRIFAHLKDPTAMFTMRTFTLFNEAIGAIKSLRKTVDCRFNCRANRKADYVAGYEEHQKNMSLPGVESAQTMHLCFEEYIGK